MIARRITFLLLTLLASLITPITSAFGAGIVLPTLDGVDAIVGWGGRGTWTPPVGYGDVGYTYLEDDGSNFWAEHPTATTSIAGTSSVGSFLLSSNKAANGTRNNRINQANTLFTVTTTGYTGPEFSQLKLQFVAGGSTGQINALNLTIGGHTVSAGANAAARTDYFQGPQILDGTAGEYASHELNGQFDAARYLNPSTNVSPNNLWYYEFTWDVSTLGLTAADYENFVATFRLASPAGMHLYDLQLSAVSVPEPTLGMLTLLGLGGCAMRRRRPTAGRS